jgi:MFS family permease
MQIALPFSFVRVRAPRAYRIAICVFFFIQGLTFSSWASRIPDIKNRLHLSDAGLGAVLFAIPVGQFLAMALSGYLVTRFGSKRVLTIAALLYPSALLLLGAAPTTSLLACSLFVFGICGNLFNISVNTQAVGIEVLYRRSIIASFHGLWSLAGFVGGIIGSLMVANSTNPLSHFCMVSSFSLLLMIAARKFILPRDAQKEGAKRSLFTKPDKSIMILGLIAFASMICEGTMFDWSGVYFEKVVHAPNNLTRMGFVAFMSTMAGGRFAADYLITRFGINRILQASGVIILSGLMLAVALPHMATATIGFLLVGLGVSSVVPLTYSLAGRSKTMASGLAIAAVSSIGFFGFLIGPPLIGFISQAFGMRTAFLLIALLGLGTTLLSKQIKQDR